MAFLKAVGPPGSLGFLLAAIATSLALGYVFPRRPRLARWGLLATLAGYLLLGWPPAARLLVDSLPAPPPARLEALRPVDTLFIFDGDNRQGRVRLVAAIVAAQPAGRLLVIGSPLILDEMPPALRARVIHEPAATTRDQIARVGQHVAASPGRAAAVLVSRLQAPRVARLLSRAGLTMPVFASELDRELPVAGWSRVLPNLAALAAGRDALYEHLALRYYDFRGWL